MSCFPKPRFLEGFCKGIGTSSTAQKPTATEIQDLESQIVKQQALAPRSFWSKIFSCFYPRVRSHLANDHQWSDYSPNHIETSHISNSAITNNDSKAASQISFSIVSDQSVSLVVDETDSTAITEMDGNVASIETRSIASTASVYTSMTGHSDQHVIFPPPKVHTTNSLSAVEFQEFVPAKSPALASCPRSTHEGFSQDEDHRRIASREHSALWHIFQGSPPPKSLSAKERLRARYAHPKEFSVFENASVAVLNTHVLDQDVEPPYLPARQSWAGYHRYTWCAKRISFGLQSSREVYGFNRLKTL